MDAATIMEIRPALTAYLHQFDSCMGRVTNRRHLTTYVSGQLSDLERKSIEPMADAAGQPPRTLQEFLGLLKWDESAMRDRLQRKVARDYADPNSVGLIDETSFHKQGKKTACVQRQHCGSLGKTDNCVVSVHLGYSAGDFRTLLDGELYLPEKTWHEDRQRCRDAGIPDDVTYRAKWRIALEQIQRALGNGIRFGWLTFDEHYGGKPPFLRGLDALGQNYVAELPVNFVGWTRAPEMLQREHARDKRRGRRKLPRLKVRNNAPAKVGEILKHSPIVRAVPWTAYRVRDGEKGPMVWEIKCVPFWIKDEDGLPSRPHRLIFARNVLNRDEFKCFLSNAAESAPVESLLLVAFGRWPIERLFEDSKSELGMDHFEVRKYLSIRRHLLLTCVSHLFLAEFVLQRREKKSGADDLPSADRDTQTGGSLVAQRPLQPRPGRIDRRATAVNPDPKRQSPRQPPQTNHPAFMGPRHPTERPTQVPLEEVLAL